MTEQPIRWGILGAGNIAGTVADDIARTPDNIVHAVAARDPHRARNFAADHDVVRAHDNYADLVADPDVDVVYLATTHGQHLDQALLALGAGKPVLIEKAFALNARQARTIVAEARRRQLFCMEAMWTRLNPLARAASALCRAGRIGEIVGVRADLSRRFAFDPGHRLFDLDAGGGALLDMGVYPTTVTWMLLGRPDTITATGKLSPTGSDLTAALQLGYADGRVAQIYTSAAGDSPLALLVTGTEGWLRIEPRIHRPQRMVVHDADGEEIVEAPAQIGNGYTLEIAEVSRCLRAGELESPLVPLDETVAIMEIFDEARAQLGVRYPADRFDQEE